MAYLPWLVKLKNKPRKKKSNNAENTKFLFLINLAYSEYAHHLTEV